MSNRVGQTFGNYQLLRLLGQGNFAEVYLGRHRYIDTMVAIKVLHHIGQETHEPFQREARVIAHLQHPHIVRIHDFGIEADQMPYLVMEYTPNGSLRTAHPKGSRLPLELIVSYVKPIAAALDYAHEQHVIHRDIKPENILLNARREVLLSDFGIAVVQSTMATHATQNQAGTPLYMAPEQIQQHPCAASDQYALGVMVYEWLCGSPPFSGSLFGVLSQHMYKAPPSLRAHVSQLPTAIEKVVFTALAKEPQQRFASVQDFASALEEITLSTQISPHAALNFEDRPPSQIAPQTSPRVGVPPSSLTRISLTPLAHEPVGKTTLSGSAAENPAQPAVPPRSSGPRRARWKLISLLVAAVLVVSGLASFFLLNSYPGALKILSVSNSATPQTHQNASSSANPQNLYNNLIAQSPSLTFYSDGWVNAGRCTFDAAHGVYNVSIVPGQAADFAHYYSSYCWNQNALYHNFLYQVDTNIARGSCTGLLFRLDVSSLRGNLYTGAQPTGYYMGICPNWSTNQGGSCQFFVYFNAPIAEKSQDCGGIVNNQGRSDTIAALAQNDMLYFFVNKKLVFSHEDTKYQAGYIALLASCTNAPTGKAGSLLKQGKFTNLKVWAIS